ncbi:helix-turn-helix domain-containing protein [Streptomyces laurentii]|uniref:helix-turn-helix domain-containing protein n=1 Tax=Streptomyces laurentii TaxID=39478 RepID=UPI00368FE2E9
MKFGPELRRRRLAIGMTLDGLAARVHYSKGQLSKVETGRQRPTAELARLCDGAVRAEGALAALVPAAVGRVRHIRRETTTGAPPRTQLSPPDPPVRLPTMDVTVTAAVDAAAHVGSRLLDETQALLGQFRRLGQTAPAGLILPGLAAQTRTLPALALGSDTRTARHLYVLSSRYAEFTGWMAQESGDDTSALAWTDHAIRLAEAAGDHDLAAYSLVRRALIALYRGDARATVELAQAAQKSRSTARIHGLAALREAQGHALAGDQDAYCRALDRGRELFDQAREAGADGLPVLGTTHVGDPVAMTVGWCLLDLGLPEQAAKSLDQEVPRLSPHAVRTRVRYGTRRALAHAVAGDTNQACEIASPLLPECQALASATVRGDLHRLSRVLSRRRGNAAVRALAPELATVLHHHAQPVPASEAVRHA